MHEDLTSRAKKIILELIDAAKLRRGQLLVIGCSSSEIAGVRIGKGGSLELAQAVLGGIYPELQARGIQLAVQCCEHLNRCLLYTSLGGRAAAGSGAADRRLCIRAYRTGGPGRVRLRLLDGETDAVRCVDCDHLDLDALPLGEKIVYILDEGTRDLGDMH